MSLSVMALRLLAQFLLKNMDKFLGKGLPLTLLFELIFCIYHELIKEKGVKLL